MASLLRGIIFFWLWYWSIHAGILLLCCPIVPLLFLYPKLYQFLIGVILSTWEMYPTVLMQLVNKTRIILSGDQIRPHEKALIIMNHQTRCDWNFFWAGIYYASQPPSHRLKMVLKAPIKKVPGPGWAMQMAGYLFIHRSWEKDQDLMAKQLDYYKNIENVFQLLIFPEGTDLTQETIDKSNKFADKNNLPHYTRVLHPKTTGFSFLVDKMRENKQLDAVYDITLAYPYTFPQIEVDLLRGIFPEEVHFHIRRYSESEIPYEESSKIEWLKKSWQQKEESLINFYSTNKFSSNDLNKFVDNSGVQNLHNALYLAFIFWTSIQLVALYLLMYSSFFRWYALFCTLSFFIVSFFTEGFQLLEVNYYDYIARTFGVRKTKSS